MSTLVYLHGFNSSPASHKAQELGKVLAERGLSDRFICPALPHRPAAAMNLVESLIAARPAAELRPLSFVGSSLGGFYATWLAEKHDARAVLINPAVFPQNGLSSYLGTQQNLYTGERYELTQDHLREWQALYCADIRPERYLLMVETGDEVLDYSRAVARYQGAEQIVVQGGDHTFQSFPKYIPLLLEFAGL
ncbi:MAG TPA: YqiA/YcfP family alpha/beta fold hydrolase [Burkholderiales bacterium]|nr:YqiA/YcfP family alpha/beta fold hydrolase [Burkholderiales bacterium]